MKNNKILYLSYDGLTDPLGQSQILPYVAGLSKQGYGFTIVSYEKAKAFEQHRGTIESICEQNKITWLPKRYHKKPPVLSTLFDIVQLWLETKKQYKKGAFHVVHCRSYVTSLVGLRAKRKWGAKFIFDMRGFWADERVEGGIWSVKNPIFRQVYNFFKKKEREFLREADHIISLTYNARQEIESWKITNSPINVIPTCVDLELFDPRKINQEHLTNLRNQLGIMPNDFILLYLGSWGTWYLTDDMFQFFTLIRNKVKAKFLIISTDVVNLPDNFQYTEDVIVKSAKRAEVPLHIMLATASVCFVRASFSKKASSATKMGELIAMEKYVVTNSGWGDVSRLLSEQVQVLPNLSLTAMNSAVDVILQNNKRNESSGVDTHSFSLSTGITEYLAVYEQVLSKD